MAQKFIHEYSNEELLDLQREWNRLQSSAEKIAGVRVAVAWCICTPLVILFLQLTDNNAMIERIAGIALSISVICWGIWLGSDADLEEFHKVEEKFKDNYGIKPYLIDSEIRERFTSE